MDNEKQWWDFTQESKQDFKENFIEEKVETEELEEIEEKPKKAYASVNVRIHRAPSMQKKTGSAIKAGTIISYYETRIIDNIEWWKIDPVKECWVRKEFFTLFEEAE